MAMIPQGREMGIQLAGQGQYHVLQVAMVRRRDNCRTAVIEQRMYGRGELTREINMFHNLQAEHHRKTAVKADEVVITGPAVQLQLRIRLTAVRDPLLGRIDADNFITLGCQVSRDCAVAAAEVENPAAFLRQVQTGENALHGWQQVAVGQVALGIFPAMGPESSGVWPDVAVLFILQFPSLDEFGRIAADDGPGIDVFHDDRSCRHDGSVADANAGADKSAGTNPGTSTDAYRRGDKVSYADRKYHGRPRRDTNTDLPWHEGQS